MAELSISKRDRNLIFQLFCGRHEQANIIDHPKHVFSRLVDYDWLALKQTLGITHIYLLGIWDTSGPIIVNEERGVDLRTHAHRCPSPFAITNHRELSPLLGTQADFEVLVQKIHDCQLQILVDFVPNHTGLNHAWVANHPNYYKQTKNSMATPAFSGDVVELDYQNEQLKLEMLATVEFIADALHVDGVRCDMAHLIPTRFWEKLITVIHDQHPSFQFIAEAYSPSVFDLSPQVRLMTSGFTAVYDEPFFRNIKQVDALGIGAVTGHVDYVMSHNSAKWVHYVSNHDDAFPLDPSVMWAYQQLCLLLPGWSLIYNGSLHGFSGRLAHHWIEILPKTYLDPSSLSPDKLRWFDWYISEHPWLESLEIISQRDIVTNWVTERGTGSTRLAF